MKPSRAFLFAGASASMVAVAFVAAPKDVASVDLGTAPTEPSDPTLEGPQVFEGPRVSNARGTYQVAITVDDAVVTAVTFLEAGTTAPESLRVNAFALPELEEKILTAQTWNVEHVSGASFTSPAMVESAQAAFDAAGLDAAENR